MEVGDDELGLVQFLRQVRRNQVHLGVVVVGIIGQQHAQAVADGDARRDNQKRIGETRILGVGQLVQRLPGDQHGHDEGLAGAGGHLEGNAEQTGLAPSLASRRQFSIQASPYFLAASVM